MFIKLIEPKRTLAGILPSEYFDFPKDVLIECLNIYKRKRKKNECVNKIIVAYNTKITFKNYLMYILLSDYCDCESPYLNLYYLIIMILSILNLKSWFA